MTIRLNHQIVIPACLYDGYETVWCQGEILDHYLLPGT